MFQLLIIFICASLCLGAFIPQELDDRIVGGTIALPREFPYQVSIRIVKTKKHTCGGSIISDRHVLTAAHCIYGNKFNDFYVVAGSVILSTDGHIYRIVDGAYHSRYNPVTIENDIALLKTSLPFDFNADVQPIALQTSKVPTGSSLTLTGWGLTSYPGDTPDYLQVIRLKSIDNLECAIALSNPMLVTDNYICTFTRRGEGACHGDSGGPLVYNGSVTGIVSWGQPCARGFPDVYTKVKFYLKWIQDHMKMYNI